MKPFFYAVALLACSAVTTSNPAVAAPNASTTPLAAGAEQHEARLLSAFFGLDNDLPFVANALCFGASGIEGMPVVLSHTVSPDALAPEQFRIINRSGQMHTPEGSTLRPQMTRENAEQFC